MDNTVKKTLAVTFIGRGPRVTGYPFLWVKGVTGFDHRNHCARCLKGDWLRRTKEWVPPPGERVEYQIGPEYRLVYICGVSVEGYHQNLHAPIHVTGNPADRFEVEMIHGQRVIVEGGTLMEIPPLPDRYRGLGRAFTRCRNFQLAVAVFGWPDSARSLLDL